MRTGRKRVAVGITMLVLAAGVAVLTALSAVWWLRVQGAGGRFAVVGRGILSAGTWTATGGPGTPPPGLSFNRQDPLFFPFAWRLRDDGLWFNGHVVGVNRVNGFGIAGLWVDVVLWPAPILLGVGGWFVLRSGRRARARAEHGRCPACGYDLSGLQEGKECPECGGAASRQRAR